MFKRESVKIAVICVVLALIAVLGTVYPFGASLFDDLPFNPVLPGSDGNVNFVNTQYSHETYRISWLRKLNMKEDVLTPEGIAEKSVLQPVTDYPYTQTAKSFKKEVAYYVDLYTLDEGSRKAAYLYFFKQLDSLTIISEPDVTNASKIEYLEQEGIVIPDDIETNPSEMLLAGALYAYMRNDFYYVVTGKPEPEIPEGTPLEEALMIYTMKLTGQETKLMNFLNKYLNVTSITSLDQYIYYTSLYALYFNGMCTTEELKTMSEDEVYRRIAIMEIQEYGISIDAKTATDEEVRLDYMAAGLGNQYKVTIIPSKLDQMIKQDRVPFYMLQLIGKEDASLTISDSYSYEKAFEKVCYNTNRFDLEDDFYSDIYEYNINLKYNRDKIYLRALPISQDDSKKNITVRVFFGDGTECPADSYNEIKLSGKAKQSVSLIVKYFVGTNAISSTTYKINIFQGSNTAPSRTGITDLISYVTNITMTDNSGNIVTDKDGNVVTDLGVITLPATAVSVAADILNQLYSTDASGNYVDQNGNVVNRETLPAGYEYTVYDDGSIGIIPILQTTSETEVNMDAVSVDNGDSIFARIAALTDNWGLIIIIVCVIALAALVTVLVIVLKKKKGKK